VAKKNISERSNSPSLSPFLINRDLSWLSFNRRVLHEAIDNRTPLLERLRFYDIFRNNMDEFVMKRIGAWVNKRNINDFSPSVDGQTFENLLPMIRKEVLEQTNKMSKSYNGKIKTELEAEGIQFLKWEQLSRTDKKLMLRYFKQNIYPILTPLAVDSGHPFPFLSNLSKSVAISMRRPREKTLLFARVKIPTEIDQWIRLPESERYEYRFINIDEIILANLNILFKGMIIEATTVFRVTRNAAISDDEGDTEDKMELVEEGIRERRFAPIVRLEILPDSNTWLLNFLMDELELKRDQLYLLPSLASYSHFTNIYNVNRPHLKYKKYHPTIASGFDSYKETEFNLFHSLKKKDYLVHFPYESFSQSVESFVYQAAEDPHVKAIKIVLYRTDSDGRLINALISAAENKKQVACIIELKARFDEESNIKWAQKLEEAGVHVSYGLMELKTHAKMIMVVRQDSDGIRTYVNIGTGNYNAQTSKFYTDFSLFTCKENIADEVMEVFNLLTGRSLNHDYKELLVAPFNMHERFVKLIHQEINFHKKTKKGLIIAKMNQLEDPDIINALYRASKAGVQIILLVRGFCCIRSGVKGLSENIKVISVIGRLLEHSRVYYFAKGSQDFQKGEYYMGSADWMSRNLFDRVEVIVPIIQKDLKQKVWDYLQLTLSDNRHAWEMNKDGKYIQRRPQHNSAKKIINGQVTMMNKKSLLR
jgi:polyphosphate kinase